MLLFLVLLLDFLLIFRFIVLFQHSLMALWSANWSKDPSFVRATMLQRFFCISPKPLMKKSLLRTRLKHWHCRFLDFVQSWQILNKRKTISALLRLICFFMFLFSQSHWDKNIYVDEKKPDLGSNTLTWGSNFQVDEGLFPVGAEYM